MPRCFPIPYIRIETGAQNGPANGAFMAENIKEFINEIPDTRAYESYTVYCRDSGYKGVMKKTISGVAYILKVCDIPKGRFNGNMAEHYILNDASRAQFHDVTAELENEQVDSDSV
jgi:phage/plasmid-associated DNA primase